MNLARSANEYKFFVKFLSLMSFEKKTLNFEYIFFTINRVKLTEEFKKCWLQKKEMPTTVHLFIGRNGAFSPLAYYEKKTFFS